MATENELVSAISETLANDGSLEKFKAEMCSKIIDVLDTVDSEKPKQPKDVLLVNELIREYLTWSGYKYAKTVFVQECGLTKDPLPRSQLLQELGVTDTEESAKFPVIYGIVSSFQNEDKEA